VARLPARIGTGDVSQTLAQKGRNASVPCQLQRLVGKAVFLPLPKCRSAPDGNGCDTLTDNPLAAHPVNAPLPLCTLPIVRRLLQTTAQAQIHFRRRRSPVLFMFEDTVFRAPT